MYQFMDATGRVAAIEFIDEGISGSTDGRPNFQRMMDLIKSGNAPFDEVIIFDLSRFSRDTIDTLSYPRILREHGIALHSVQENFGEGPAGMLHMTITAGVNEYHNSKGGQMSSEGQATATILGYEIGPWALYGYTKERVTIGEGTRAERTRSILVIDPETAPIVQRIFTMCLQGHSTMDITKTLNKEGIISPGGKAWSRTTVAALLHNIKYTGVGVHGLHSRSKFDYERKVTYVPDHHPAIISNEKFEQVQEALKSRYYVPKDPDSKHPRRTSSQFLFSGFCRCMVCGLAMNVRHNPNGRALVCTTNRNQGAGSCPNKGPSMPNCETTVLNTLLKHVLTDESLEKLIQEVEGNSQEFADRQDRELETVKGKLQEIQVQRDNIIKAIAVEGKSVPALADYMEKLDQQQAELEARKLGLDSERSELLSFLNDKARIIKHAQEVRTYLKSKDKNMVRAMVETFVEKVEVDSETVTIHYRIPMPPHGPGKKRRVETVPIHDPQRPIEHVGTAIRRRATT
jgi:site-specific DNA recombinase